MNKLFMLVSEEVRFAFKNRWGYKISIVSDLVVITATFILMFFFQSSLGIQHYYDVNEQTAQILYFLGFLFWQFGTLALGFCSSMISNDARSGILELEMQSGYPVWLLVFVRMIANLVLNLVIVVVLIIVFYFLSSISLKEIGSVLLTLLINLPSLFGMFGMGLLIGSVNLKEKGTNSITLIVQALLLFLGNVSAPLTFVWQNSIPFAQGIEIMRAIYLGIPVSFLSVLVYLLVNAIWLAAGIVVFDRTLHHERVYGTFDMY